MASPRQQRIDPKKVPAKSGAKKGGRPGGRPPGAAPIPRATLGSWIAAARPQTLPLAIAPVALGTATAYLNSEHPEGDVLWHWLRALLCLAVALFLQVGVNFANDYSDGVRGTDRHRVGPARLTASGAVRPRTVILVAFVFFGLSAAAGLVIVFRTQEWWLLAVGAAAIVAAYFYTGGKRPYGYYGLGEVFVFLFFGLVATVGTEFAILGRITLEAWIAGAAIGFIACAVLMVNNIRDREQDELAGKRTLAVLLGDLPSRIIYSALLLAPFGLLVFFTVLFENAYLVYFALLAAIPAVGITMSAKSAPELVIALRLTTLTALLYGVGLGWAIAF